MEAVTVNDGAALLTDRQLAAKLQVSRGMIHKLDAAGKLPMSVRLGRCKRWRSEEIDRWIAAGAPSRAQWESVRGKA